MPADSARRARPEASAKAPPRLAALDRGRPAAFGRTGTVVSGRRLGVPPALRMQMIREAAYRRAEARGFAPGGEVADWLAAEGEVDEIIESRYRY